MELTSLTAISPLDGRYSKALKDLRPLFGEYALIKHRVIVEIRWLQALAKLRKIKEIPALSKKANHVLDNIIDAFSEQDAKRVKTLEVQTNHDVKAVEYFLKEKIADHPELAVIAEFIHFACTSEDINNLAYALMLKAAHEAVLLPAMNNIIHHLVDLAHTHADQPMLSRTHGQPATPTTLGKEMGNISNRLKKQYDQLKHIKFTGKLNGAVGNFNAHLVAYPEIDWLKVSQQFVTDLELCWNAYTTQIEPHDTLAEYLQTVSRFNTILLDFSRDMWGYISLNYFKQKPPEHEVGSSTMPHKINPIDFENAEGNLGLSNTLCEHLSAKLPISRWQRDLSDSTLMRNIGASIAYALLAYHSIIKGIKKLDINAEIMAQDLEDHWEILAEPIQTVMRRYGIQNPYEKLKSLTQHQTINKKMLHDFINTLNLPETAKSSLLALTPKNYLGNAISRAKEIKS